jgi:glyoxylase-like metal-dependent hydrolase (beta-lactamase superfamily II)
MKKKGILFLVLMLHLSFFSVFSQYSFKLDSALYVSKYSDTVYIITHFFPWESNSLIIKASDSDIVLIDTPYDNDATLQMLNWIKKNLNPQNITAINTGFHIDNLGGNGCLLDNKIDIYGSDLTVKLIDERSYKTQQQILTWLNNPGQEKYRKVYESMVFKKPNHLFKIQDGLNLKIGSLSFEVFYPGESHSPDNVVVYIKELHLLFGGCMVKSLEAKNLGFTGDANLRDWPTSIRKIQKKYPQATIVIPHHGNWGDRSLLKHTLDLFNN